MDSNDVKTGKKKLSLAEESYEEVKKERGSYYQFEAKLKKDTEELTQSLKKENQAMEELVSISELKGSLNYDSNCIGPRLERGDNIKKLYDDIKERTKTLEQWNDALNYWEEYYECQVELLSEMISKEKS